VGVLTPKEDRVFYGVLSGCAIRPCGSPTCEAGICSAEYTRPCRRPRNKFRHPQAQTAGAVCRQDSALHGSLWIHLYRPVPKQPKVGCQTKSLDRLHRNKGAWVTLTAYNLHSAYRKLTERFDTALTGGVRTSRRGRDQERLPFVGLIGPRRVRQPGSPRAGPCGRSDFITRGSEAVANIGAHDGHDHQHGKDICR